MDQRIRDDLRGLVKGEILDDSLSRVLYSTDASIFQVEPLGIVVPRDEEDVQAVVRYAGENNLALVPRGAGSGMAGEALGAGLILDLSRHFRSILEVGSDTVRVQPGVVLRDLNARLAREGRRFAPDPSSATQCTIGGMLATNASGARSLRFGYTRDHVASLRAVLDTGDAAEVGLHSRWPAADRPPGRLEDVVFSVATLLEQNATLIETCRPRTPFNRLGYLLHDVLTAENLDLAKLLVGTEGTLAVFTEATLRTVPLPAGCAVALLGCASLDAALRAATQAIEDGPSACELIDRRLLTLARGADPALAALVSSAAEAVLLVEFESDTAAGARRAAARLAERLQRMRLAVQVLIASEPEETERFWGLREAALPGLYGLRGGPQPVPFIEDVGVPAEELASFLHQAQDLLQRHETTASFLIHAATGQVHTRPFLDIQRPDDLAKLHDIAEEFYTLVLRLGGTVSTQHGTGLARTRWVERQYGPLYPVFRELKAIFDPRHVFNPGKIVSLDTGLPAHPLRHPACRPPAAANSEGNPGTTAVERMLRWRLDQVEGECNACNGCGHCRTERPAERMCPIFRADHTEAATPRAKANLMRSLLRADADPRQLASDQVREVADLCVNCKMCALECPAHVDIPRLMLEAKAANHAEHGLSRSDWVLARTESFAWLGSAFAPLVNAALDSRSCRWLLEKVFGLSRQRRLPTFARESFLHRARRRGWTRLPRSRRPRVAYFIDVFANYNDPQIAEAVVRVLHHHGFDVYVPPEQLGCGMAPLAYGDVEASREVVRHNLRLLADLARDGWPIICSEPTAALMLRHDAGDLLDDPDVQLVAGRVVELTTFLWDLHRQGKLRTDFRRLELALGHHVPCHLKALGGRPAGPGLLELIPGMRVHTIDVSCSGMAGTFGLAAANYATSRAAGKPMLDELSRPRVLFGSTECSPCRLQMEDGSGKRTLHPAQYLAFAYGLLPEVEQRLREPIRSLVLR